MKAAVYFCYTGLGIPIIEPGGLFYYLRMSGKAIGFALDPIQGQGQNLSHRKGWNGQRKKMKFCKSSCQSYPFIILITTLCSMFRFAYIIWNWFGSSSIQYSIEISCLILVFWYNCLRMFSYCILCTYCNFQ